MDISAVLIDHGKNVKIVKKKIILFLSIYN